MAWHWRYELTILFIVFASITSSQAGPLSIRDKVGSIPLGVRGNITDAIVTTCTVGDSVYSLGDTVPGRLCEECHCSLDSVVRCLRKDCEPNPGCKALHRSDHCCPLYQCECEQGGTTYGNGQKLVDPSDPCKVCYCQGGEIVCTNLACFKRDDCEPRYILGRCCPEYDHCPLRGSATELPRISTKQKPNSTNIFNDVIEEVINIKPSNTVISQLVTQESRDDVVKKEITIKEITPVSEIPSISGIRIKEIIPAVSIEINDFNSDSTKAPLIPREALFNENFTDDANTSNEKNLNDSKEYKNESITTSPVLKIGDIYLKIGDINHESTDVSTPATIITLIGAEGLQRGEEEDNIDHLSDEYKSFNFNYSSNDVLQNDLNITELPQNIYSATPNSIITTVTNFDNFHDTQITSENSIQELNKDSYDSAENDDEILVMERNLEYPPIPDDIMILNSTDDSSDIFLESAPINSSINDNNIVLVKQPVFTEINSLDNDSTFKKNLSLDIFDPNKSVTVEMNENDKQVLTNNPFILKNSPMMNLNMTIPELFLNQTQKWADISNDSFENISNVNYLFNNSSKLSDVSRLEDYTKIIKNEDVTEHSPQSIYTVSTDHHSHNNTSTQVLYNDATMLPSLFSESIKRNNKYNISNIFDGAPNLLSKFNKQNETNINTKETVPYITEFSIDTVTFPNNQSFLSEITVSGENKTKINSQEILSEQADIFNEQQIPSSGKLENIKSYRNEEMTTESQHRDQNSSNSQEIYNHIAEPSPNLTVNKIESNVLKDIIKLVGDFSTISNNNKTESEKKPLSLSITKKTESYTDSDINLKSEELIEIPNVFDKNLENNHLPNDENLQESSSFDSDIELMETNNLTTSSFEIVDFGIDIDKNVSNEKAEPTTQKVLIDKVTDYQIIDNKTTMINQDVEVIERVNTSLSSGPKKIIMANSSLNSYQPENNFPTNDQEDKLNIDVLTSPQPVENITLAPESNNDFFTSTYLVKETTSSTSRTE